MIPPQKSDKPCRALLRDGSSCGLPQSHWCHGETATLSVHHAYEGDARPEPKHDFTDQSVFDAELIRLLTLESALRLICHAGEKERTDDALVRVTRERTVEWLEQVTRRDLKYDTLLTIFVRLRKYVTHDATCVLSDGTGRGVCDCGLNNLYDELQAEIEEEGAN